MCHDNSLLLAIADWGKEEVSNWGVLCPVNQYSCMRARVIREVV